MYWGIITKMEKQMEKTMEHEMESTVIHSERLLYPPICARCDRMLQVDLICRR